MEKSVLLQYKPNNLNIPLVMGKSAPLQYNPGNGDKGWCLVSLYLKYGKIGIHYECLPEKSDEELALTNMRSIEYLYANFHLPFS